MSGVQVGELGMERRAIYLSDYYLFCPGTPTYVRFHWNTWSKDQGNFSCGDGKKTGIILSSDLPPWSAFFTAGTTYPHTFQLSSEAPDVSCSYYQSSPENLACFRKDLRRISEDSDDSLDDIMLPALSPTTPESIGNE